MNMMNQQNNTRHILIVDDDYVIRNMMTDVLELEAPDIPVQLARNGREALQFLQGGGRYLVFLDLMMPQMDGSEVCQALDERPHLRSQHIIVLMSAMDKLAEASALNVDATMPKPFTVDDIMRILQRYLND